MCILNSGICIKISFSSIRVDTFDENCSTCFLMYRRKLSLRQRPNSLMVVSSMPASFIAMAPPERIEGVPISDDVKPSSDASMMSTTLRSSLMLSLLCMWYILLFMCMILIGVFIVVPGYERKRIIVLPHAMTGHSSGSPVAECITVSFLSSFFWTSNVIAMDVAVNSCEDRYDISLFSL